MPRTRRVDCSGPGLRRVRRGKGFSYHEEDGERVTDAEVIDRISGLAIPPAWTDVWICSDPRGHIQATGIDAAGRKQYRYHDDWRARRDRQKFDEMLEFARRLPRLRRRIDEGLAERGLVLERVSAAAVGLLDRGLFRIGSERYEDENESYGLTTLKVKHLHFENGAAVFEYPSKSGQTSSHEIADPALMPVLKALAKRGEPDEDLLGYRDGREWRDLTPVHVNSWIKDVAGEEFSAKDFRTWNATVLAAMALAEHDGEETTKAARKRIGREVVESVAAHLNNTPAVCRASYIDPRVFDRFDSGQTVADSLRRFDRRAGDGFADREAIERAVVDLLE
jgi:DNA topoisomerase-1